MDKKEQKRDVAVFSNMLKEMMNKPMDDKLVTLDRDLQHFIYGRIATLVKHNNGQPIGSISDISTIVGAALADVLKEFVRGRADDEKISELFDKAQSDLLRGFEIRRPKYQPPASPEAATEPVADTAMEVQS
jgi:hypothetical protein